MRGAINIILGLILVVGALWGNWVLIGTNSSLALAVGGGALILLGLFRLITSFNKDK